MEKKRMSDPPSILWRQRSARSKVCCVYQPFVGMEKIVASLDTPAVEGDDDPADDEDGGTLDLDAE